MTGCPPHVPSPCICAEEFTGLRFRLVALYGALQAVEWLTADAKHAADDIADRTGLSLPKRLELLQDELVRAQGLCLLHAFPEDSQ